MKGCESYSTKRSLSGANRIKVQFLKPNSLQFRDGKVFGLVKCDKRVPPNLHKKFVEFPPVFKNVLGGPQDNGAIMREIAEKHDFLKKTRKMLVGSMCSKKILLGTLLVIWYLQNTMWR